MKEGGEMGELQRYMKIFSGNRSEDLWGDINATTGKTHEALYSLGCACQRLENIVTELEKRIAKLELER